MNGAARIICIWLGLGGFALPAMADISGSYLAARQAGFSGDFENAAHYFGRALAFDPTRPDLLENAILANIALGQIEEAALLAQQLASYGFASELANMALLAREAQAQDYAALIERVGTDQGVGSLADGLIRSWALLGLGDQGAALAAFDETARQDGMAAVVLYHKALALAYLGAFEQAEASLLGPDGGGFGLTRRGYLARAEILSNLGRHDQALDLLRAVFGSDTDPELMALRARLEAGETIPFSHVGSVRDGMAGVFFILASLLESEGQDELTLIYARVAQHLDPDHSDALLLSAELLINLGQNDLAVATYEQVPANSPASHSAGLGLAEALRVQGRIDEATDVLHSLSQNHGNLPVVWITLGDLLREREEYSRAVTAYSNALAQYAEITARQWFLFYARGISYERAGNWSEAEADFRRALDLRPDQPQVLNYLGYSLVEKQDKLDEALGMIEKAVTAEPSSGYIVDSLGWALYRLGRFDEAVVHMERAAELMPIDPVVNDHLGDTYWAVGRLREARFMWRRALSFVDWKDASAELDPADLKRKIEIGLDAYREEQGLSPLQANARN